MGISALFNDVWKAWTYKLLTDDEGIGEAAENVRSGQTGPRTLAKIFQTYAPNGNFYDHKSPITVVDIIKATAGRADLLTDLTGQDVRDAFDGYIANYRLKPALELAIFLKDNERLSMQLPEAIAKAVSDFVNGGKLDYAQRILSDLAGHSELLSAVHPDYVRIVERFADSEPVVTP